MRKLVTRIFPDTVGGLQLWRGLAVLCAAGSRHAWRAQQRHAMQCHMQVVHARHAACAGGLAASRP